LIWPALALAAAACVASDPVAIEHDSQPLIGGVVPSFADDPDPDAVALTSSTSFSFCTGTLVSPQVIMTAGHCIDMLSGDPSVIIFFGVDLGGEGARIGVSKATAHPEWTGSLAGQHDIGLVRMNFRAPEGVVPTPLSMIPISAADVGQPVHRAGFGIFNDEGNADGRKRIGDTVITSVPSGNDWFLAGDSELMTCNGDSGGPAYADRDGVKTVVGVHSFGFGCQSPDNGDTRVDLYAADFVIPWIQDEDPTCGEDGFCAKVGCIDDPDCTPCGPDGTCTTECALPDVDCATQNVGEICRGNPQCTSELCVFWTGDGDYRFCSEECVGDGDCPAGLSCQNIQPFGNICYYDDEPPGVVGDGCEEHTDCGSYNCEQGACVTECNLAENRGCLEGFECSSIDDDQNFYCHKIASGSGGCSVGRRPGPAAWLAAVGLLAWIRRRRKC
jgi:MYXO-CTERM domain-containing protein